LKIDALPLKARNVCWTIIVVFSLLAAEQLCWLAGLGAPTTSLILALLGSVLLYVVAPRAPVATGAAVLALAATIYQATETGAITPATSVPLWISWFGLATFGAAVSVLELKAQQRG
jgi:hypothetical protein